ncbi:SDR family NAD(P)-dependent oxidoreductase [Maribacter sp. 2210JD10-5]|uniref:SDR family NAD(P)-dependent oxidoreductase n=1 Tax=Maribacter sp. 2210JD10-5 TaxID=3386272 RepID=UPI0039BC96A8
MIKAKYDAAQNTIVIVGVNSGIGQALVNQLLESNATVYGVDIQAFSKAQISDNFHYFKANPLDKEEFTITASKIAQETSIVDGLVNLSGTIKNFRPIEELDITDWNETYDISFKSCFNSCKLFSSLLKKSSSGAIVNMVSGLAFIGQKNYGPYSAGKASVLSFSRTLAAELAPRIRVNSVAPGAVDTPFIYKEDGTTRFDVEAYKSIVPLGTMAKPEEISSVILFLLSDGASHLTGQCIHINGGAGMN